MPVLRSIESKIESLFEGVFGRAFRTNVQPIELARKLVKEMDEHKNVSVSRVYVPNEYTVYLSPADRKQFAGYEGSLVGELQEYLAEHARRERYALVREPKVTITEDDDLAVGEFGIATRLVEPEPVPADLPQEPPAEPASEPVSQTIVYRASTPPVVAPPAPPMPDLVTLTVGGAPRRVSTPSVVIGRSRDADVRLSDEGISRRHAEIRLEDGAYWLVDLGSMNGTRVNGKRVDRARLADGDAITVGSTEIVFGLSPSGS